MSSNNSFKQIGVIGAGSFGTVVANLCSENADEVLVYARSDHRLRNFNELKENNGYTIKSAIRATSSIEEITKQCTLLIALIPSKNFRNMVRDFSTYLDPHHIIIHGTKGVDIQLPEGESLETIEQITRNQIFTMSEVIREESSVRRIGCLAGPNLSREIAQGQPAGAIVASKFDEVIQYGKRALNTERFKIFSSSDLLGAEFAGVLKNIFAIASGILFGLGFGNNARALLITKGMHEMLHLGNKMGAETSAFLGIAGIGDLVATCSSELSRNFTVGKRIANNEGIDEIMEDSSEVAEGVRSIQIFYHFSKEEKISVPITDMLYKVIFQSKDPIAAVQELMTFNYSSDVSFL